MTTNPTLIGLTGYAGTGKDTVRAILDEHGYHGLSFAEPLRAMLRTLLDSACVRSGWMYDRALKEQVIPELGVSYRHLAQTLGTEWGRNLVKPDLWLRLIGNQMSYLTCAGELLHPEQPARFVISDVRFIDEAAWVRKRGGVIWRIDRPGVAPVRSHQSEQEMDTITPDLRINNAGDINALRLAMAQLVGGGHIKSGGVEA